MPIDVFCEVVIERPRSTVAAYAEDATHDTTWIRALQRATPLTDGPFAKGSRVERVASMMGREITYVTEVVGYEPGRLVDMATVSGPFPMLVTYTFADAGPAATRVRIRNRGGKGFFFTVGKPLLAWMVNSRVKGDLVALKRAIESEPDARL